MGVHVSELLAEAGHEVVVTSRRARVSDIPGVSYVKGNAKETGFLSGLLTNQWDAIIDFMVWSTDEFKARASGFLNSTTYPSSPKIPRACLTSSGTPNTWQPTSTPWPRHGARTCSSTVARATGPSCVPLSPTTGRGGSNSPCTKPTPGYGGRSAESPCQCRRSC